MPDIIPQPAAPCSGDLGPRFDRFASGAIAESMQTDWWLSELASRICALEEITAARWPARISIRRRLRRQLREDARGFAWAGPFAAAREEALLTRWLAADRPAAADRAGRTG